MSGEKFNPNPEEYKLPEYPDKNDPEEKARLNEARKRGRELSLKIGQKFERGFGKLSRERNRAGRVEPTVEPTPRKLLRQAIESGLRVAQRDDTYLKPEEEIDLGKFTSMLESIIAEDKWIGERIRGWNLIPMKSGKIKEPIFKLVVELNDYGRKIFQGTHREILDELDAELGRIDKFERGEAVEE
jgi:hypothetical protein